MIKHGYDNETVKPDNQLRPDEFPHFYYTKDEDNTHRYHTEKKLWQKLCRGETKPIVSYSEKFVRLFFNVDQ